MQRHDGPETADYVIFAFLIGIWTLPGAALGVVMFAPWLAPSLFTPFSGFFFGALLMYVADGLGMPLMLLLTGIRVIATSRGWWWLVAWIATVATGFAFECATLPFLISMARARGTLAGHWHWEALAWGGSFLLLAVAAELLVGGVRRGGRRRPAEGGDRQAHGLQKGSRAPGRPGGRHRPHGRPGVTQPNERTRRVFTTSTRTKRLVSVTLVRPVPVSMSSATDEPGPCPA